MRGTASSSRVRQLSVSVEVTRRSHLERREYRAGVTWLVSSSSTAVDAVLQHFRAWASFIVWTPHRIGRWPQRACRRRAGREACELDARAADGARRCPLQVAAWRVRRLVAG